MSKAMRTIKFKPSKRPRLPKSPDMRELRGSLIEIARALRFAREKYMRDCQEAGRNLRGKQLALYLLKVADRMITCGLYSDGPTVGMTAYCIMCWFARFEAGSDYWARHRDWRRLRGMTQEVVSEMRWSKTGKRRIIRAKGVA